MKSLIALLVLGMCAWLGFSLSGPIFDAAAHDLCSEYGEDQGWELVEASGVFGRDRKRNWFRPRSADYWCTFEDASGETVFLDQLDGVMPVTWESRGLRIAGWVVTVGPMVGGMAIAGWTGLLKRD